MSNNMMYTAISGLDTFSSALSVISDNIANANTTAYKSNTLDFGDLVSGFLPTTNVHSTAQGVGSMVLGVTSDFGTGGQIQTGTWSNLMIQGNGFFCVQDPTTKTDYYTRDGSFQLGADGYLEDMHGNQVLESDGKTPIQIEAKPATPVYSSYAIDKFGNVTGTAASGTVTTIGQIGVTTFPNPNGLIRDGQNMYTPGSSAGAAILGTAGSGQAGPITSGTLEGSNVDLTTQMVDLITYQADYQANSKSVQTGNDLLQTVVNLKTS
ncbi:MAG: flagellar hook basal-body protein [Syntrophobacteraceae bacterium]|jgi:flagellar hook protein FlgE